jgi:hypothetical protein
VLAGRPGQPGYLDGPLATALFNRPRGICVSPAGGDIFVVDSGSYVVRRISAGAGEVTTVVGAPGEVGLVDGQGGRPCRAIDRVACHLGVAAWLGDRCWCRLLRLTSASLRPLNLQASTPA